LKDDSRSPRRFFEEFSWIRAVLFDSNWELSSARATRIARIFPDMKAIPPERISTAGYAEFHPVASNNTAEGRSENRRVDLVVLPRTKINLSTPEPANPTGLWRKITDDDAPAQDVKTSAPSNP
jgi:chemotaxis protein MotB